MINITNYLTKVRIFINNHTQTFTIVKQHNHLSINIRHYIIKQIHLIKEYFTYI